MLAMTLRLPEHELRQLYEWWRRGDLSLYAASKCLRCEPRTVMRRWAQWDEYCRRVIEQRDTATALRRKRQLVREN